VSTGTATRASRTRPAVVTGAAGDAMSEAIELTKRLRLPYLRKAMADVVPTAKAQRWDPAEVVRILLAEEAAGRDEATLRTRRRRAAFPAGKTFDAWDENTSSIPRATQQALRTLEWVHRRENLSIGYRKKSPLRGPRPGRCRPRTHRLLVHHRGPRRPGTQAPPRRLDGQGDRPDHPHRLDHRR
jgi:hypothetical protein